MTTVASEVSVALDAKSAPITTNFGEAELPSVDDMVQVSAQDMDLVFNERVLKFGKLLDDFINEDNFKEASEAFKKYLADPTKKGELETAKTACIRSDKPSHRMLAPIQKKIIKNYIELALLQEKAESRKTAVEIMCYYRLQCLMMKYKKDNIVSLAIAMAKVAIKTDSDKQSYQDIAGVDGEFKPFTIA